MSVQKVLDRKGAEVFTTDPTATVRTAAHLMRARAIAALVVKSADVVSGLITERDIVHAVSQHGERALAMAVSEVMTRTAVSVTPGDSVKRAMSLMTNHRLRHLTVINEGKLVGIVSIGDVVKQRLAEAQSELNELRNYISSGS